MNAVSQPHCDRFPTLKLYNSRAGHGLFLKQYGFDISLYQAPYKVGRFFLDTQISAVAPIRERSL